MMLSSWRWPSGAGTGLILASIMHYSEAAMNIRHAVSPSYRYGDACPVPCLEAGPNPANWTLYSGIHEADDCQDTIHYVFNVHGDVDSDSAHHVFACTADGGQQSSTSTGSGRSRHEGSAATTHVTYDISHWSDGPSVTIDALQDATSRILDILSEGFPTDADGEEPSSLILFTKSPTVTTALYMGHHVSSQKTGAAALTGLQKILDDGTDSVSSGNAVAMQLCGSGYDGDGVVGFVAVPSDSSVSVRKAVQSWSQAQCASFPSAQDTSTMEAAVFHPDKGHGLASRMADMLPRAECKTTKVATGDSCASLAKKCGIKPADFTKYNPSKTLCSDLKAGQHVCCSSGTMPDFAPKPNPNGTCATYTIKANDDCPTIAAANSLTIKELKSFNEETWGFSGCDPLQLGARICLSKGDPPMPAPLSNAQCGPQKPGTKIPDGGTRNISSLNQCPLNVCCNIWGQCGSTKDYCIDTNTGAPGTAKKGTNGCISNCGLDIVQSDAPSKFIKLDYYEAFGMNRDCLFQDISQIDLDSTTHIHFSFATMDKSYAISVGETIYDEFQFEQFARLDGVHKVVTIGGWDFSTLPDTYNIFRDGVKKENRKAMATSILNFVKSHSIDGIDIDWEYPGVSYFPPFHHAWMHIQCWPR